jgi:hypothetical protein
MKIQKNELVKFLKINECVLNEAIFDFTDTGVVVKGLSPDNTVRVDAKLLPTAFTQYESIGKIGLQEIKQVVNALDKFSEEVNISVEGNLLTVKGEGKKLELELVDTQFIVIPSDMKELTFNENVTVNWDVMKAFFNDASVNRECAIFLKTDKGKVIVSNDGKFKFTQDITSEEAQGGVSVKFGTPLTTSTKELEGDVKLSLSSNYPAKVVMKNDKMMCSIVIAPQMIEE